MNKSNNKTIKIYPGYGHTGDLVLYGHVFNNKPAQRYNYTNNILINIIHIVRLFFVNPLPFAKIELVWENQLLQTITEKDGFFKFEWASATSVPAGWHTVTVNYLNKDGIAASGEGSLFVPHVTQYGFISDIDDTVLVSHSSTIRKRLRTLFTKNPRTRKIFKEAAEHYKLLADAHTEPDVPNPFFYVSSSEWNLFDDLVDFFDHNQLPKGAFLLNQVKRWYQLFKTGKTKHEGKLIRIVRILHTFPKQKFVLLGDNSQQDPAIYASIAAKYPSQIFAVYIRNIHPEKEKSATQLLKSIEEKDVYTCFFKNNTEAIEHSKKIGLIFDKQ